MRKIVLLFMALLPLLAVAQGVTEMQRVNQSSGPNFNKGSGHLSNIDIQYTLSVPNGTVATLNNANGREGSVYLLWTSDTSGVWQAYHNGTFITVGGSGGGGVGSDLYMNGFDFGGDGKTPETAIYLLNGPNAPNAVITGFDTGFLNDTTLTIGPGVYRINNQPYTIDTANHFVLAHRDSTNSAYEVFYAKTDGTIADTLGVFSGTPVPPNVPANTAYITQVLITPNGYIIAHAGGMTAVSVATANTFSGTSSGGTAPVITINQQDANGSQSGKLTAADWISFSSKQAALVNTVNIKSVGGISLLGSGDVPFPSLGLINAAIRNTSGLIGANALTPVDLTSSNLTLVLPTSPADRDLVAIAIIAVSGGHTLTLNTGGTNKFQTTGGSTTYSVPNNLNQAITLQFASNVGGTGIGVWYILNNNVDVSGLQPTGNYITALTGDGTASGPGSSVLTLATVNSNVGSFGDASHTVSVTANAKGLVTAISSNSIQISESQVTNLTTDLAGKQATLTGPGYVKQVSGSPTYVTSIPNADLANSSITINGTPISLGASVTVGSLSATNFVYSEVPSGTINSSNTTFTIANTPTTGTVRGYRNGVRTTGFTVSGTTVTMTTAPLTGDTLLFDYMK